MSKEHYCYKIYTLLIKNSPYSYFYRQLPLYCLSPPFSKNLIPAMNKADFYSMKTY